MFLVLSVMNDCKLKMNLKHHISIPKTGYLHFGGDL
jgi:hypothetical protein